jgi:2,3-bisphosphoglycerate-independent phosphoglycerate mutase
LTQPVVLMVLDGWGLPDGSPRDAISAARKPAYDALHRSCPRTLLSASGEDVGLPAGQIGNSEVGHLNLGAGRVVYQELTRINRDIATGAFVRNPVLLELAEKTAAASGRLHVLGLLSDGGVHSHQEQMLTAAAFACSRGLSVFLHAFMDGRDTPPRSGLAFMREAERALEGMGARVATVCGRFYAMDRDTRWERVEKAYRALTAGEGLSAATGAAAVEAAYARGENDEFILPTVVRPASAPPDSGATAGGPIGPGDAVLFMNFRGDRAREITRALALADFTGFARGKRLELAAFTCLTEYDRSFPLPVAYPPEHLADILGEVLAGRGIPQLRIAETEKYAHVTFFFNGGVERSFPGEDRVLVPSPREVSTYDQKPQMSAPEVTAQLLARLDSGRYGFVLVNYANPDMVGHTGVFPAAVAAIEALDPCIGAVANKVQKLGGTLIVTADHGNAECMRQPDGSPHTAHTTNPVPLVLVGTGSMPGPASLRPGRLADVAPTILKLMGIPHPPEMTGTPLY